MKKYLIIFLLMIGFKAVAQDPASSQFFFNPLYLNPAFAGANKDARVGGDYRRQWTAIPSKFVTYNCWADIYNPYFNGGLGIIAMQDVSGEGFFKTTSFGIIQSYERMIPRVIRIRAGYNITVINKHIDWDKLVFSDQLDGIQGQVYPTNVVPGSGNGRTFADVSAGFMLDIAKIQIQNVTITNTLGYAMNHITQPNEALSGGETIALPRKQTFHYTMLFELQRNKDHKSLFISPNVIYQTQANFKELNLGFYVTTRPLIGGLFYRKKTFTGGNNDSFICFLGVVMDLNKTTMFRVGYSYDFTINKLGTHTMGSHEISLTLEFKDTKLYSKKMQSRRKTKREADCEDFGTQHYIF
jgi:type IX secretion system PorP/SprF family membrane protein